jgi:ribosomal protein S18 acetylase RimI-like enzyme
LRSGGATFDRVTDAATTVVVERLTEASEASVADINALLPQLKSSWDAITVGSLDDVLSSATRVYVARVAGAIVGLTLMVPHRHFAGLRFHVEDVVVSAEHRRSGIARRLLEVAMADVPAETISFDLRSHHSREAARGLYESLGFEASDTTVFRRPTSTPALTP